MILPRQFAACKAAFLSLGLLALGAISASAEWQREATTLAWKNGTNVVWRFSFDPKFGKPFFNPVTATGGKALTNFRPEDHPWHYGMWFSWKYINHVNYWEEDRATGKPEGATRWTTPDIKTRPDGGATISLDLTYTTPSNRVDMTEHRVWEVSAPAADGSYMIDWKMEFTAGSEGAVLDRTPMPGEPEGKVNGGYAGLGIRMASAPMTMSVLCTTGLVTHFESDRARPAAPALACNFSDGTQSVGGIAILSDPSNAGLDAPWYVINAETMRFACAAILAPKIRTLPPAARMKLHYRVVVQPQPWTVESLKASEAEWMRSAAPAAR